MGPQFTVWHHAHLHSPLEKFGMTCPPTRMFMGCRRNAGWFRIWRMETYKYIYKAKEVWMWVGQCCECFKFHWLPWPSIYNTIKWLIFAYRCIYALNISAAMLAKFPPCQPHADTLYIAFRHAMDTIMDLMFMDAFWVNKKSSWSTSEQH